MKSIVRIMFFVGISLGTFFTSCKKDDGGQLSASQHSKIMSAAKQNAGYDELACVVGNCVGTRCDPSTGKTCKGSHDCEAVPGGCLKTKAAILAGIDEFAAEHADSMLANNFIDSANWQHSRDLAYSILLDRANSLP